MAIINFGSNTIASPFASNIPSEPKNIDDNLIEDSAKAPENTPVNPPNIPEASSLPPEPIPKHPYPIYGTIWCDLNNNGIKDQEDTILKGIEIELYTSANLKNPVITTITDEKGNYYFKNITLDHYLIKIDLPKGYTLISKCDYSSINPKSLFSDVIYNDTETTNILIGLAKCFNVRGIAFLDQYDYGIYKNSSKGINDININLYDDHDNLIYSTITSTFMTSDGYFEFNDLPLGRYKVVFDVPKGIQISTPKSNYFGSKANPNTNTAIINITNHDVLNAYVGFRVTYYK